jgi:hypothetical protein
VGKGRLEAFSDGVLAIIITIMVLELRVPHGDTLEALRPLVPVFFAYLLSFLYIGIYWNNHHHMLHAASKVTGPILWANLHLLFWLSLLPFATAWAGRITSRRCRRQPTASCSSWRRSRTGRCSRRSSPPKVRNPRSRAPSAAATGRAGSRRVAYLAAIAVSFTARGPPSCSMPPSRWSGSFRTGRIEHALRAA